MTVAENLVFATSANLAQSVAKILEATSFSSLKYHVPACLADFYWQRACVKTREWLCIFTKLMTLQFFPLHQQPTLSLLKKPLLTQLKYSKRPMKYYCVFAA